MVVQRNRLGVVNGLIESVEGGATVFHPVGSERWMEFVSENAKQSTPIDLNDKIETAPLDVEQREVRALLKKHDDDLTLPELSKIVKRLAKGI